MVKHTRRLLDSNETTTVIGLGGRDHCRDSLQLRAHRSRRRPDHSGPLSKRERWFRLNEKGGNFHEMPGHHRPKEFMTLPGFLDF
jgi:hypothetical protein